MNPHNRRQKIDRLVREIEHYERQICRFEGDGTPQGKRCHTRAKRCLSDRQKQLQRVFAR